nr:DUF4338 domain-containing protein [Nitrococcus mobilis]
MPRLRDTCYPAANWACLGSTTGRGKRDRSHRARLPVHSGDHRARLLHQGRHAGPGPLNYEARQGL